MRLGAVPWYPLRRSMSAADPPFERALVATLYLLGERGENLDRAAGSFRAPALARSLASGDREARAAVLASEVAKIAMTLDAGRLR